MARGAVRERPAAVPGDRDAQDLVPLGIERGKDGAGGRERDLVLARAAPGEQTDPEPSRHGVVDVVVVVAVEPPVTMRPTVSVTVEPGFSCVLPFGLSART